MYSFIESILSDESNGQNESVIKEITDMMSDTKWQCFETSIEMSYRQNDTNFYADFNDKSVDSETRNECQKTFMDSFSSIKSLTSKQEFLKRMRYLIDI